MFKNFFLHFKHFSTFFLPVLLSCILQFLHPSAASASSTNDCINPVQIPASWKSRFPFDLVYPVNSLDVSIDTSCPTITLFATERQMCAPMTLAKIAKNAFLLKIVVQSLLSL